MDLGSHWEREQGGENNGRTAGGTLNTSLLSGLWSPVLLKQGYRTGVLPRSAYPY